MPSTTETARVALSPPQQYASHLRAMGVATPVQVVVRLEGALEIARLRRAYESVVTRHAILRSAGEATRDIRICDVSGTTFAVGRSLRDRCARAHTQRFDRQDPMPPIDVLLVRRTATRHDLVLTASPWVADVSTLALCANEIVERYAGSTPSAAPAYGDVADWQRTLLEDDENAVGRRYWTAHRFSADGALPFERDVPLAGERKRRRSFIAMLDKRISLRAVETLGCTEQAWWLACWQALLARLLDATPPTIAVALRGRTYPELAHVVGPLDPVVPAPFVVRRRDSMTKATAALDAVLKEHADWQEYFDGGDFNRAGAGFAYMQWPPPFRGGGIVSRIREATVDATGARLALTVHDDGVALRATLDYDAERFDRAGVRRLAEWLQVLAADAVTRADVPIVELSLLTAVERAQVVSAWNATAVTWPADVGPTLVEWVERQATATPDAIAVWTADGQWTYAALDAAANQIARRLIAHGVGTETRVAVWLSRAWLAVVAVVGVIKAGGAYVPLDPSYPVARLQQQVVDAAVTVVLTEQAVAPAVPAGVAIEILDAPKAAWRRESVARVGRAVAPTQLAYIIYTSGSTGTPKGAMNAHAGVVNRLVWMAARYASATPDRVLQKTAASFDVAVWELFWPLGTGGTIVVAAPGGHQDPQYLADVIARAGVTVVHFVPTMLEAFVAAGGWRGCAGLRLLVSSGEALPAELVARVPAAWRGQIENLYGPTEAAVDVTAQACARDAAATGIVPIGRPVANTQVYVVDGAGQPAPWGVPGELWIGGVQVGRGYWRQPARTAAQFVPDPFSGVAGARVYRTGDRACWTADGVVRYLGRADGQVKVRGQRIELGEIEAVLRQQPGVRAAAVIVREDAPGVRQLVGYLVPATPAVSIPALRAALGQQLPAAMVPAHLVSLAALPLLPNGKLDRRQLPAPETARAETETDTPYAAPRTAVEATLAALWAQVLRRDRVGIRDNFFALGGDSILGLQIVARVIETGVQLTPQDLFDHPTVAQLAGAVGRAAPTDAADRPVEGAVRLTPIQRWFFEHHAATPHHYNQAIRVDVTPAVVQMLDRAWAMLLRRHDALRFRYARTTDGWHQTASSADAPSHVTYVDLRLVAADRLRVLQHRVAVDAQRSLHLERGPVARAIVGLTATAPPDLLLVAHHLVVDGVSWRILLDDLEAVCRRLQQHEPIALPPAAHAVRQWSDALHAFATTDAAREHLAMWRSATAAAPSLPCDFAKGPNSVGASRTRRLSIDADTTHALLHDPHARDAGAVDAMLLAALTHTLARDTGQRIWRIDVEGHGREALGGVDVSRTVGWFTAIYPVRLIAAADVLDTWRSVEASLRAIPQKKLTYGVLRYLDARPDAAGLAAAPHADVLFNYLGQADGVFSADRSLRPSTGPLGPMRRRGDVREYLLEINAIVTRGQLRVNWTYGTNHHATSTIERLGDGFADALRTLVTRRDIAREDERAASTFSHGVVDADELARIARALGDAP